MRPDRKGKEYNETREEKRERTLCDMGSEVCLAKGTASEKQ